LLGFSKSYFLFVGEFLERAGFGNQFRVGVEDRMHRGA
jgi:hypothetical protein